MRTSRACRTDANQSEIVERYQQWGFSVAITSNAGDGFTDIVVGRNNKNYLVEIKDGSKIPSQRKLTPDQQKFHDNWQGNIRIVETVDDVDEHAKSVINNAE